MDPTLTTVRRSILRRPLDLPVDRLRRAIATWEAPAFLEGGAGLGPAGRWSILAARPRRTIEATEGGGFRWSGGTFDLDSERDPLEGLATVCRQYGLAGLDADGDADDPPFRGGLIGHLGYDLAPRIEKLPRRTGADSRIPALRFGLYDTFVLVDHRADSAELWAVDLLDEGPAEVRARRDRWQHDLQRPIEARPVRSGLSAPIPDLARPDYLAMVRRTLDYIRAGDIFQANLSQRFVAAGPVDPFALHDRLRAISPAPYASYLAWDDLAIVGASPELFYQAEGDAIRTRPIKGTRPRSPNPALDAALAAELLASAKDRAELTMIIDLERNDLGRACRFGTVRVADAWRVESFAQVHHLVATVEGRLRADVGPVDVIRALFPGGSITGAPKIRAMEIIDELEPSRRSLYTGAVGYLSRGGRSAFNIAIRTILVEGDRASYQVGGGIVADSDPGLEYEETLHKGRGLRQALESFGGAG